MKNNQLFCIHLLPRTASHGILPSRTLNMSKSTLLKSRAVVLLFALFPPVSILGQFCMWFVRQKDVNMSHGAGPFMAHRAVKEKSSITYSVCKRCETRASDWAPQCYVHTHPVMDHCYALEFSLSHPFSPSPNLIYEIHLTNF